MEVSFYGVRGSIPTPGPQTVRYGGNTTCVSVITEAGDRIILDAGTGIRRLGLELMAERGKECAIFITHTHWDHIQGLPFFAPLFESGRRIHIHGAVDPVYMKDIREILAGQMQYCYFPVQQSELRADIDYVNLHELQTIRVGSARVSNILMNHSVTNFGYRVEADGSCVVFTGDHEPLANIYSPNDPNHAGYQRLIDRRQAQINDLVGDADVLIADAMYTRAEYEASKRGWGHGTHEGSVAWAESLGIERLYLTHHDPARSDDELDAFAAALDRNRRTTRRVITKLAREGEVFRV